MDGPLWSDALAILALAALLTLIYRMADSYITRHMIKGPKDNLVLRMFVYLVLGSSIGLVTFFLLCQTPFGKLIDGSFVSIGRISDEAMFYALIAGVLAALATAAYLWAYQSSIDVSLAIPIMSISILYIAVGDVLTGRVSVNQIGLPVVLVVLGVFVALFQQSNWKKVAGAVVLLLLVNNSLSAVGELLSKPGVDLSNAITFSFYRFFWLTVTSWVIAVVVMLARGELKLFFRTIVENRNVMLIIGLQMILVFFATGYGNKGLALSNATIKNLVLSLPIVLSVVMSAIVNRFVPGAFDESVTSRRQWVMRFVGALLMTIGVLMVR